MDSDFEGIPPLGDSVTDEASSEQSDVETEDISSTGKYRFNGRYLFATWSHSTIEDKLEFEQKLIPKLPEGTRYFGGREEHKDGSPHYHVLFKFENKKHMVDAHKELSIEGDTNAIRIAKPRPRQKPDKFCENVMAYCAKDGNTFGERFDVESSSGSSKTSCQSLFFRSPCGAQMPNSLPISTASSISSPASNHCIYAIAFIQSSVSVSSTPALSGVYNLPQHRSPSRSRITQT